MADPRQFYDQLADTFHLIFEDWDRSINLQGDALVRALQPWPCESGLILDVAAGIGTHTLALAGRGFELVSSDLSMRAVRRARIESAKRSITVPMATADFRALPFRSRCAAAAIACDNAIPHLLSDPEIETAMGELARCVRPGGGVVISVRDYAPRPAGTREIFSYGEREWQGRRYVAEQEWEWHGRTYTLTLRIRPLDGSAKPLVDAQTTYYAVSVDRLLDLMRAADLEDVERIDGLYYQPLLVGTVRHPA